MYCNDPTSARQAICFHLDSQLSHSLAFIQYPQIFYNINKKDKYDGQARSAFAVNEKALCFACVHVFLSQFRLLKYSEQYIYIHIYIYIYIYIVEILVFIFKNIINSTNLTIFFFHMLRWQTTISATTYSHETTYTTSILYTNHNLLPQSLLKIFEIYCDYTYCFTIRQCYNKCWWSTSSSIRVGRWNPLLCVRVCSIRVTGVVPATTPSMPKLE